MEYTTQLLLWLLVAKSVSQSSNFGQPELTDLTQIYIAYDGTIFYYFFLALECDSIQLVDIKHV